MTEQQLILEQPPETHAGLVERVYSKDPAVREQAQAEVGRSGPDRIGELISIVETENKKKPLRFGVAVALVYVVIIAFSVLAHAGNIAGSLWMLAVGAGAAFAPTKLQKATARALAQMDDVRAVGPLAEALVKQDGATKNLAIKGLIRLLPRMKYSDNDLLTQDQRKLLYGGLAAGGPEYTRALVRALEQIGDGKALPYVQKLSEGKGVAKKNPDIAEDAKQCLPVIQERAAAEQLRDTLLRAAGTAQNGAEELLRPASGAGGDDVSTLVRPAQGPAASDSQIGQQSRADME